MNDDIYELLANQFYDLVPFNVAIIDKSFNVILANNNFKQYFGDWKGRKCYEVYKKSLTQCKGCQIVEVFEKGTTRVSNEYGLNKNEKLCHYVVHDAPITDKKGKIKYVVEMSTDITETSRFQREYDLLFENVPSYVSIIDRNFKIIRANKDFVIPLVK